MSAGRFAPSPTAELHVGNLRTAVLAWCMARNTARGFVVRMEDLTTEAPGRFARSQLADLAAIGITSDVPVVYQSGRTELYSEALARLAADGLTYECWCTRREIREAVAAPHGPPGEGRYPGTCARLGPAGRAERARSGRPAALRLRADGSLVGVSDGSGVHVEQVVDDFVLRRGDGTAAYNLAVVVDDADQGVDQVVRGADLLDTTPRQVLLARLLGLAVPEYFHVPLVLGPDRERLAKRHGAVTLGRLGADGVTPARLLGEFARSLAIDDLGDEVDIAAIGRAFRADRIGREPWVFDPARLVRGSDRVRRWARDARG